ncbi:hypothetical protein C8F01DRAFT_1252747 [Mycena amicta]|nr:hypothetical protein C8F01DRAFT_1252747 [Mycena amicta]
MPSQDASSAPAGVQTPSGAEARLSVNPTAAEDLEQAADNDKERERGETAEDKPEDKPEDDDDDDASAAEDKPKKKQRLKPVDELQSNKGWARGGREALLEKHIAPFKRARALGKREGDDYLVQVINEYSYVFPWNLAERTEPEVVRPWTPTTPPDSDEGLTDEERTQKGAWIKMVTKRIHVWLVYRGSQPSKKRRPPAAEGEPIDSSSGSSAKVDLSDPFTILMFELAGMKPPSRATPGLQQFMHEEYESVIEPKVRRRWQVAPAKDKRDKHGKKVVQPTLEFGTSVARDLWKEMSEEEKQPYRDHAAADAKLAKEAFAEAKRDWPRTDPASRQLAINNVEFILKRIMTKISEMTGLHILVALGGPIPIHRGDIQIMDFAFGDNLAPSPVTFPEWDPEHFEEHFREKMKRYLATAYTAADRAAASLPEEECIGAQRTTPAKDDLPSDDLPPPPLDDSGLLSMPELPGAAGSTSTSSSRPTASSSAHPSAASSSTASSSARPSAASSSRSKPIPTRESQPKTTNDAPSAGKKAPKAAIQPKKNTKPARQKTAAKPATQKRPTARQKAKARVAEDTSESGEDSDRWRGSRSPSPAPAPEPVRRSLRRKGPAGSGDEDDEEEEDGIVGTQKKRKRGVEPEKDGASAKKQKGPSQRESDVVAGPAATAAVPYEFAAQPLEFPIDAGDWLDEDLWKEVTEKTMGEKFRRMLELWVELEQAYKWQAGTTFFPAIRRPKQVTAWIQNARVGGTGVTTVGNESLYGRQWWAWWNKTQPGWREIENDCPKREERNGRPWGAMVAPGKNGILSVLASLYWWGGSLRRVGSATQSWMDALEDVTWVLEGLKEVALEGWKDTVHK